MEPRTVELRGDGGPVSGTDRLATLRGAAGVTACYGSMDREALRATICSEVKLFVYSIDAECIASISTSAITDNGPLQSIALSIDTRPRVFPFPRRPGTGLVWFPHYSPAESHRVSLDLAL